MSILRDLSNGWVLVGECEIALKKDNLELQETVLQQLELTRVELLAKLELLEVKKKEFLAIEYVE